MDTYVRNDPLNPYWGKVPDNFDERAEAVLLLLPAEWDSVTVTPQFKPVPGCSHPQSESDCECDRVYVGPGWMFSVGERYAAVLMSFAVMESAEGRARIVAKVRYALSGASSGRERSLAGTS